MKLGRINLNVHFLFGCFLFNQVILAQSDEAADEADAETLEEAEEEVEASLTDAGETEEVEEARTSASDWLRKNILKSTASIEK